MKIKNIKMYSLSEGKFIVSYYDDAKSKRIQKNFTDEVAANTYLNELRAPNTSKTELGYLKTASADTAMRVFIEQNPNSFLGKSPKLVREFLEFFSAFGVPRLTEENLRSFFAYLKNEYDWADRSLLVAKSRLQGFFRFLVEQKIIENSPIEKIIFNRGAPYKRKPVIFSEVEIKHIIEAAKKRSPAFFYPIFLLVHEAALKRADIIDLRWKDINFKTNTLSVSRSTEIQARSFQVSDELIEAIQKNHRVSDYVFTNLENQPLKIHITGRELKKFQIEAGFKTNWGLRDLRFSHGINFLKSGGSYVQLQKIMGHRKLQNTEVVFGRYEKLSSNLSGPEAV